MAPPIIESKKAEKEAILETAKLMLATARTAPKTGGKDDILTIIVHGAEKEAIAKAMEEKGEKRKIEIFKRDANNVRKSEAIVLIGVRGHKSFGLNCGACGYKSCKEFDEAKNKAGKDFIGPICVFKALDLGIAIGSAVKTASLLNVDNRVMYTIGATAQKMKLLPEATVIIGIPLSAKGKNIYFDRKQ